jgi:hypothetical protein
VGKDKTFDDIQEIVERIRAYLTDLELVLQSLDRMQGRGPVESSELRLRRREALRIKVQGEQVTATGRMSNGRRSPTAITAPVPTMMEGISENCVN